MKIIIKKIIVKSLLSCFLLTSTGWFKICSKKQEPIASDPYDSDQLKPTSSLPLSRLVDSATDNPPSIQNQNSLAESLEINADPDSDDDTDDDSDDGSDDDTDDDTDNGSDDDTDDDSDDETDPQTDAQIEPKIESDDRVENNLSQSDQSSQNIIQGLHTNINEDKNLDSLENESNEKYIRLQKLKEIVDKKLEQKKNIILPEDKKKKLKKASISLKRNRPDCIHKVIKKNLDKDMKEFIKELIAKTEECIEDMESINDWFNKNVNKK